MNRNARPRREAYREECVMTAWLIRRFIQNSEDVENGEVRAAYGVLGSCVGILLNLLLCAGKFLTGRLSGSLAITADAANNLSDAAGSIVALISTRLARKPVDAEHPFGHGRMEYLGSLGVGALIVVMALGLLRDGVEGLLHPQAPSVSAPGLAVLVFSLLCKGWLYFFYHKLGSKTCNSALLAASKDSLGDVLATGAVLLSSLLSLLFGWKLDGPIGVLVALIVLKAGYEVCRDTVDRLLGGKPDPEKSRRLRELLTSYDGILGVHDLVMHDYGPGRCFASVHAEVSDRCDVVAIHETIDRAEREIGRELNIPICIHMDPIATEDGTTNRVRQQIAEFLREFDPSLSMHDFRMVSGKDRVNLIFDVVLPSGYKGREELQRALSAYALSLDERYFLVLQFDTDYA